jgi:rubredoxin
MVIMAQPTGGVWIGEYYYAPLAGEVLAAYREGKLVEIEVDGKLFLPAPVGTLRCSDCKHTMSENEWERYLDLAARTKDEYVEIDCAALCPLCGKGMMEEVS